MTAKLYSFKESGNCYKVRLLAALIGEELEIVEMDFLNDEHHSPEYLKINPKGQIPALFDQGRIFTDSSGILVYLAGKHPESRYWSTDLIEQAAIVDWLSFASGWVQYGAGIARGIISFQGPYSGLGKKTSAGALEDAQIRAQGSLKVLDNELSEREWLALNRPTIADISVFVYVALAPMGDISLEPYPNVRRWITRIRELPSAIDIVGLDDPNYRRQ